MKRESCIFWNNFGRILGGLIFSLFLSSCLQYVPPLPAAEKNNPPRIEPTGVDPTDTEVLIPKSQDPTGETIFKVVQVSDPDRDDVLYAYWFLDYERFPQGALRCEQSIPAPASTSPTAGEIRQVDLTCRISHSEPSLVIGKFSILQLFIVDRKANISDLLRSDGVMRWPEGSKWDQWTWVLKVE